MQLTKPAHNVASYSRTPRDPEPPMVICPIAIAVGCKKCPIFDICPVKSVIGDYKPDETPKKPLHEGKAKGGSNKQR
jgi:hypothetical protein